MCRAYAKWRMKGRVEEDESGIWKQAGLQQGKHSAEAWGVHCTCYFNFFHNLGCGVVDVNIDTDWVTMVIDLQSQWGWLCCELLNLK